MIGMQRGAFFQWVNAFDVYDFWIFNKEVTVSNGIQNLSVECIEIVPRELNIHIFHTDIKPVIAYRFRLNSSFGNGPHSTEPDIIPACIFPVFNSRAYRRSFQNRVRYFHETIVVIPGLLPAEVFEDIFLSDRIVKVIFSSDDMSQT